MKRTIVKLRKRVVRWLGYEKDIRICKRQISGLIEIADETDNIIGKLLKEIEKINKSNEYLLGVIQESRKENNDLLKVSGEIQSWWKYQKIDFLNQVANYVNNKKKLEDIK